MKKFLKILLIIIVVVLLGGLAYTYISYNNFSPGVVEAEIDETKLAYFQDSYDACRQAFLRQAEALNEKFFKVEVFSRDIPSENSDNLMVDFCCIPAQHEKSRLLIISSGVHGVEGYVGSAVQQMLMDKFFEIGMLDNTSVMFIHGINPYGFKYSRRVTENNIDFNRNSEIDKSLFSTLNTGYADLYDMLNPTGEVNSKSLKNKFFMLVAIKKLMQESMASLRQAVLQGQYEYPEGLYFGGNNFEPQLDIIGEIIKEKALEYDTIMNIDLHTGYGTRGILHLFPNPVDNPAVKQGMEQIFEGYQIDWGDSDDFYTINGSFSDYIGKILPGKFYIPMSFEFGTLNSQTTIGSVKSIHNMILENQGKHYGYKTEKDSLIVMNNFVEMYNPSSETWRCKALNDVFNLMEQVLTRFQNF